MRSSRNSAWGKAALVLLQIVAHLAVGLDDPTNPFGRHAPLLMNRSRGDQALDIIVIGICQETHHRHGIVRFVLDIGEHEDARLLSRRGDRASHHENKPRQ